MKGKALERCELQYQGEKPVTPARPVEYLEYNRDAMSMSMICLLRHHNTASTINDSCNTIMMPYLCYSSTAKSETQTSNTIFCQSLLINL